MDQLYVKKEFLYYSVFVKIFAVRGFVMFRHICLQFDISVKQ